MARKKKEYTRLRGKGRGVIGALYVATYTLWLGSDHVLLVKNNGYSEDYKRFYFRDIQAITARKTITGKVTNAILGFFAFDFLAFLLAGLVFHWDIAANVTFSILASFFLLPLAINWLKGPTCACHLRTAVQTERLYSLNRMRKAMRVIRQLRAIVESVQGTLTPEAAEAHVANQTAETVPVEQQQKPAPAAEGPVESRPIGLHRDLKPYASRAHDLLFVLLLADLCHACVRFIVGNLAVYFAGLVLLPAMISAIIVALIKQNGTNLYSSVKVITWCTLAYLIAGNIFASAYSSFFAITNPGVGPNTLEYLRLSAAVSPFDSPALMAMQIFSIICCGVLGISGIFLMHRFRLEHGHAVESVPPAVPPPIGPGAPEPNQERRTDG